ncbi:HAD family hydrolase [Amycolatopsis sp. 195334CR]|uniref:HAD family hydrolase n=1 Tax=Amycolatopsis sp. 195334CR TaxID=2814588 RepID=UPI001F5D982C|nr:HAD family hydrolase [Amycolatopsis sp. 195334CR]
MSPNNYAWFWLTAATPTYQNPSPPPTPFDVFRHAATLGDDEARYVEAAFTALEVEVNTTAEPTPGAHDLIRAWHETGRPLAIVSNNSTSAVAEIDFISARVGYDAEFSSWIRLYNRDTAESSDESKS